MHFKSVLAHLESNIFFVGQPWWSTFFHTSKLLKSHVRSRSAPGRVWNIYFCLLKDWNYEEHVYQFEMDSYLSLEKHYHHGVDSFGKSNIKFEGV